MRSIYRANLRTGCFALAYRIASRLANPFALIAPHSRRNSPRCITIARKAPRILRATSRIVSTIHLADYIMLLCSATQHQPLTQTHPIAQGKATPLVETGNGYGYRMTERGAWQGLTPTAGRAGRRA